MKLILNENRKKLNLSEGIKYHLKNKISITESIFRMGSDAWCDLVNESRDLYYEGNLNLSDDDIFIIESNAGSYGEYKGEDVPLDAPFPINDQGKFAVFCLNEQGETKRVVFSA
jgi:hypothetical protein